MLGKRCLTSAHLGVGGWLMLNLRTKRKEIIPEGKQLEHETRNQDLKANK